MSEPITEATARELIAAINRLTAALEADKRAALLADSPAGPQIDFRGGTLMPMPAVPRGVITNTR